MARGDILPGAVCEMGKVKLGTLGPKTQGKKGNEYNPMVKLDHFLITTLDRDESGVLIPDTPLMEALSEYRDNDDRRRLRTIPILFPSNSIKDVLDIRYQWWLGRSQIGASTVNLVAGDAMVDREDLDITWYANPQTGELLKQAQTDPWADAYLDLLDPKQKDKPLLTLSTTLSFMIASTAASFGGVYRFRTKGWHSSNQLLGSLRFIKRLTCGILRGPVFKLVVRPKIVRPNGITSTVQVVHVECTGNDLQQLRGEARAALEFEASNLKAIRQVEAEYKQLTAGRVEDEEPDAERITPGAPPQILTERPEAPAQQDPPPPEKTTAERQAEILELMRKDIAAAADLARLQAVWKDICAAYKAGEITDDQFAEITKGKDGRKAKLAAPAPQQQQGQSPPAPPPPPPPATKPEKAGLAICNRIETLCVDLGQSWGDVRAEYAEVLGITATRVKDLTADQAMMLHDILKAEVAKRKPAGVA